MAAATHIALLRGINLASHNRLSMAELSAMFEASGAEQVRTYIQSGNVVYRAGVKVAKQVGPKVEAALHKKFGHPIPLVLRTGAQLQQVATGNPYLKQGAEPEALFVGFLAHTPDAKQVAALDPARGAPDEFSVLGAELYLRLRTSAAKTRLTNAWFDSRLETVSTMRNWRTVLTLAEWSAG